MKIFLITLAWPDKWQTNIYKDLLAEFNDNGHEVFVLTTLEKRFGNKTMVCKDNGIKVHRVACGNITKTGYYEKTVSLLLLNKLLSDADNKYFKEFIFDLILVTTPSITFSKVVKKLKKRHHSFVYLLLKDMWPQGSVDLGVIKKKGLIWRFFRHYEKTMYKTVDKIGCMSEAAVSFLLNNNPGLDSSKVEVCPNSLKEYQHKDFDKTLLLEQYNIPLNKPLIIYGGNISISHGVDFLLDCIEHVKESIVHFIVVGSGTHFYNVKRYIDDNNLTNITLLERLPSSDYQKLLSCADVGMALLNPKYTVPQFPSKIIDYLRLGKPIIAITNKNTDIGSIIVENKAGFAMTSYNKKDFAEIIEKITSNPETVKQASKNAIALFNRDYTTEVSYNIIMNSFTQADK